MVHSPRNLRATSHPKSSRAPSVDQAAARHRYFDCCRVTPVLHRQSYRHFFDFHSVTTFITYQFFLSLSINLLKALESKKHTHYSHATASNYSTIAEPVQPDLQKVILLGSELSHRQHDPISMHSQSSNNKLPHR